MKKIIVLILLIFSFHLVYGEKPIKLSILYQGPYQVFYTASFDPDHPLSQPLLFKIKITKKGTINDFKLALEINSDKYGELLTKENGTIQKVYSFNSGNSIIISNRDIISSNVEIAGDWNDILRKDLQDQALETGMLPAGIYRFTLYAMSIDESQDYDQITAEIEVINPTNIVQISPGSPFSSNPTEIVGNLPVFSWFSNIQEFTLEVFKVESGESIDDIRNKNPFYTKEQIHANIFIYPADAPLLKVNRTYAWRIKGIIYTTQGENSVESNLWNFKIASSEGISPESANISNFIENLENLGMIDKEKFAIGDFTPTGDVYLNGEIISIEKLVNLLNDILSGKYEIERIETE
ncbi:MAG: hypothetical protein DRH57_02765 [Candidatus Cloacimonadota bacterium]|nr:MAG: hypothetical protein DRH57_02765 [Candidatus Cloacimonadota bacterium]